MSRWYVKELASITGVSVQTLHHYDHIGLLNPSEYSSKGYRLYNQTDLIKLQQIIALKFFGFELKQIKTLLSGKVSLLEHLLAQASFLDAKGQALLDTSRALKRVINEASESSSLPWKSIINLIEIYRMTEKLENSWVKDILSAEELKQYVQFEAGLKDRFSTSEKEEFYKNWASLVEEIKNNLKEDPTSKQSMKLAKRVMKIINNLYGDEHVNLRHIIWEKGFKGGFADKDHLMSPEIVKWLDEALYAYYSERIYLLLNRLPHEIIDSEWQTLMKEMFANNKTNELEAVHKMLANKNISNKAKNWLKKKYTI